MVDILQYLTDPALLGGTFGGASFRHWRILLAAAFAVPYARVVEAEGADVLDVFRAITSRPTWPLMPSRELLLLIARRGGKSIVIAAVLLYVSLFSRPRLAPGERPIAAMLAADRRQASVIRHYVEGLLLSSAVLRSELAGTTEPEVRLRNGVTIEIATASYRLVRGRTMICAVCDEIAFWFDTETSSNPAAEILRAIRPALATTDGQLWMLSSPFDEAGVVGSLYQQHYGVDGSRVLVAQADTRTMNPTFSQDVIDAAYADDPVAAAAEYGGQFRSSSSPFVDLDTLRACTHEGMTARPYERCWRYAAFLDAASGSGSDAMTLAIAHREQDLVVLDRVIGVEPPFSPEVVVREFAEVLRAYRLWTATCDRWGGAFVVEAFRRYGIEVVDSAPAKSDIYRDFLPLLNSRRVRLLDDARLQQELVGLRRTTRSGGREVVDHRRGHHDDHANAAAGALTSLISRHFQHGPILVPCIARG